MKKQRELQVGDVFMLKSGMTVYTKISKRFCYTNTPDDEKVIHDVKVGSILKDETKKTKKKYYTTFMRGEYVVIETNFGGGGTGMGPHDVYPDGWKVIARKLKRDGTYNPEGRIISFYQSGCFTAMNEYVPRIRKMKMTFK